MRKIFGNMELDVAPIVSCRFGNKELDVAPIVSCRFGNKERDVAPIVSCRLYGFVSSDESNFLFNSLTSAGMNTGGGRS